MIISPPITPPQESPPAPADVVIPRLALGRANEGRLKRSLRGAAKTQNPIEILALAAMRFFWRARNPNPDRLIITDIDDYAEPDTYVDAVSFADLAVTGRMSYDTLKTLDMTNPNGPHIQAIKATTRLKVTELLGIINIMPPTDAEMTVAVDEALDRAYAVAWALRGPVAQQAALRASLSYGWITVSSEDDKAHRPVNMHAPPYEQYEIPVTTSLRRGGAITLSTRFFVASTQPAWVNEIPVERRKLPPDPNPALSIPHDHEVILFLHGHSSGAEEALHIIPHLLKEGLKWGKKYAIISFDLPNNGYSQPFNHTDIAESDATTFPVFYSDNTPIMTPILDFIEDFVVSFVDALDNVVPVKGRFAAVIGGSLGGNLGLRLGRRNPMPQWLNQAIVSWSPASAWAPFVKHAIRSHGPGGARGRYLETEAENSRRDYFNLAYDKEELPGVLKAQSKYWYREDFPNKALLLRLSRLGRQEIYNAFFRQWHWRVGCEQLIFSHVANETYGDSSTPVRYTLNTVPTLLAAGEIDNYTYTGIYEGTRYIGIRMTGTPGRLLLLRNTGHSIHAERPAFFASEIVQFLRGLKPDSIIAALIPARTLFLDPDIVKVEPEAVAAALIPARTLLLNPAIVNLAPSALVPAQALLLS